MSKAKDFDAYELFRELLKELRAKQELTQVQLAERLGLPQSYVSKVETGERRLDVVETRSFCEALGVDFLTFARTFQDRVAQGPTPPTDRPK